MWKFLKSKWLYKLTDNEIMLIQVGNAMFVAGVSALTLIWVANFADMSGNHIEIADLLSGSIVVTVIGLALFIWSCVVIYRKGEKI